MHQPANRFANAYQDQLLHAYQHSHNPGRAMKREISLRERLTNRLGNAFITLGERIKGECTNPCPEMARGHA